MIDDIDNIYNEAILSVNNGYLYEPIIIDGIAFDSSVIHQYKTTITMAFLQASLNQDEISNNDFKMLNELYNATKELKDNSDYDKAYQMATITTHFNQVLSFINKKARYMDDFETIKIINSDRTKYMVNVNNEIRENNYRYHSFCFTDDNKMVACRVCYPNTETCTYSIEVLEDCNDNWYISIDEDSKSVVMSSSKEEISNPFMDKEAIIHVSKDSIDISANLKKHASMDACLRSLGDIERSLKYGNKENNDLSLTVREHYYDEKYLQMQEEMLLMMEENPSDDDQLTEKELQELEEVDSPLYDDGLLVEAKGKLFITEDVIIVDGNEKIIDEPGFEKEEVINGILFHPRIKSLVKHVVDELDSDYINTRAFIYNLAPLIKDILDTDMEIDNEADELLDQIYNPACDFGEKSYFIGDTNDKGYNQ